jgi:UDP-2,3-diacylglucosamine hydrolase
MDGESIGLIAGSRNLPLLFAREARGAGLRVVAAAFTGETDPAIETLVDETVWLRVGQLGGLIDSFTRRGVRRCAMLGQIAPRNLFDVRPDFRALGVLLRLKRKNAHTIFGAIADELARDGVELIDPRPWLGPWMPAAGRRAGKAPPSGCDDDLAHGLQIAKEVSRLEIGQTVVVKGGTVLAVEGFEGTDACLERGGKLAGKDGGAVAVKVAKEGHDMRFDIPCIGPRTVEICADNGVRVLGVEGGRAIWLDREELEAVALRRGISVAALQS